MLTMNPPGEKVKEEIPLQFQPYQLTIISSLRETANEGHQQWSKMVNQVCIITQKPDQFSGKTGHQINYAIK